jgi:hypothetical protein
MGMENKENKVYDAGGGYHSNGVVENCKARATTS